MFGKLGQAIVNLFTQKKLDEQTLQELEETLISCDISVLTSQKIIQKLGQKKLNKDIEVEDIKKELASEIMNILQNSQTQIDVTKHTPFVFLMSGVNGAGKTTTIAKLAYKYKKMGKKILIAGADTFRAAAVEQLKFWADKVGVDFMSKDQNADPSSVAFEALKKAQTENYDVLFIDTAGRLQNKENLMAELGKMLRTLQKLDATAPHASIMVLDATTGQNAVSQLEHFSEAAKINSLIITKLDGSSKAGVVISLFDKFHIPVSFIGSGEGLENLEDFEPQNFTQALLDIN